MFGFGVRDESGTLMRVVVVTGRAIREGGGCAKERREGGRERGCLVAKISIGDVMFAGLELKSGKIRKVKVLNTTTVNGRYLKTL